MNESRKDEIERFVSAGLFRLTFAVPSIGTLVVIDVYEVPLLPAAALFIAGFSIALYSSIRLDPTFQLIAARLVGRKSLDEQFADALRAIEEEERRSRLHGGTNPGASEDHASTGTRANDIVSARARALATLGLPMAATPKEIRLAYRKIVLAWHPDRFAARSDAERLKAEAITMEATKAYRVLVQRRESAT